MVCMFWFCISQIYFRPTLVTDFANAIPYYADLILKPDYADMTCLKHENADPHYTPKNVKYTPRSSADCGSCSPIGQWYCLFRKFINSFLLFFCVYLKQNQIMLAEILGTKLIDI